MTAFAETVSHDDVLRRTSHAPAVFVVTRLEHHAIVAGVERAILDKHVHAGIGINAVVVRAIRDDLHAANRGVDAIDRMDRPVRSTADGEIFEQHIRATHERQKTRSDAELWFAENPFRDRHALRAHLETDFRLTALPIPPLLRVAVQLAFAGHCDVRAVPRVDEWRIIVELDTTHAHQHHRQIIFQFIREDDFRAIGQMKIHATAQMDRSGQKLSIRHDHSAATRLGARSDGDAKCRGATRLAVRHRAELRHVELARRKLRRDDAFQDRRHGSPGV